MGSDEDDIQHIEVFTALGRSREYEKNQEELAPIIQPGENSQEVLVMSTLWIRRQRKNHLSE